jgi:hypothetical protein
MKLFLRDLIESFNKRIFSLSLILPQLQYEIDIYPLVYSEDIKGFIYDKKYESMVLLLKYIKYIIETDKNNIEVCTKLLNDLNI